jgi:glycosyltransferase involved in cell wall biosynthesis
MDAAIVKGPDLTVKGGAERIVLELAEEFNLDVYTSNYDPNNTYKKFNKMDVYSSPVTFDSQTLYLLKFLNFPYIDKLRQYDLIVLTSGFFPRLISLHNDLPPTVYYAQESSVKFEGLTKPLDILDRHMMNKIDRHVVVSEYVQNKFSEHHKSLNFDVIYPPVDTSEFYSGESEEYFLSVQRIIPDKQIKMQLDIFRELPYELIIVGGDWDKEYLRRLNQQKPDNVSFRLGISDQELLDLYAHCTATIQTSGNEDFGLIPIESMAAGKPCLAVNEGGFRETIQSGQTGMLVNKPYIDNFINTISAIGEGKLCFNEEDLIRRANEFSTDTFLDRFRMLFEELMTSAEQDTSN